MDYFYEKKIITTSKVRSKQAENIWNILVQICKDEMHKSLIEDVSDIETDCNAIIKSLQDKCGLVNIIGNIPEIIESWGTTYSEGLDKICLIVDRDKGSFASTEKKDQYGYVLKKCKEKHFGFYITNPCFEFWLLLHFDYVHELDKDKLLANNKVRKDQTYAEHELRKIFRGYKKSSYSAEQLVRNIDKAITNEKNFCEDVEQLKSNIGSNVGLLIEEMRK